MTYYQPTVEVFKYSLWKGKWVQKAIYPSTLIFQYWSEAEMYHNDFIEGLKRRGVKLKPGEFEIRNAQLIVSEKH